jgi:predicted PurR-regulated permease PerM
MTSRPALQHPLVWGGIIAATLATLFLVDRIFWLALPFILAVIFSYICRPFLEWMRSIGRPPGEAFGWLLTLITVAALLFALLVMPLLFTEILNLPTRVPEFLTKLESLTDGILLQLAQQHPLLRQAGFERVAALDLQLLSADWINSHLHDIVTYLLGWIPSLLLVPYLGFFFVRDGFAFKRLVMRGVPNAFFEKVLLTFEQVDRQIRHYFQGLMAMTLLDTVTLALGLWVLGWFFDIFPWWQALLLGLLCAVLGWIPYVGSVVGCILVVMVCVLDLPGQWLAPLLAVVLFVAVRLLDDFVYTPLTIGRSLSIHPLLTVLVIFVAGALGGVSGMVLAMPVLGIMLVLGDMIGTVVMDDRLRARHQHSRALRRHLARDGLNFPLPH